MLHTNGIFQRQGNQNGPKPLSFTAKRKAHTSRVRVYWPDLKPLKGSKTLKPVEGVEHLKRLEPAFQQQQQTPHNSNAVLVLGCKAVARLVWRRARFSRTKIPTLVMGVGFHPASDREQRSSTVVTTTDHRQSLAEIFEAVRDVLVEMGITEYGLEVTVLDSLPAAFEQPGDGLLGQVTYVVSMGSG